MNLRINSLLIALATALLAVVGDWSCNSIASTLWRIPAGLLLAGLAYESLFVARTNLTLRIDTSKRWLLGRTTSVAFQFKHVLRRDVLIQFAPDGPPSFFMDYKVQSLNVAPNVFVEVKLDVYARQLGSHFWPVISGRISGSMGLAWWSVELRPQCSVEVTPEILDTQNSVQGLGMIGGRIAQQAGSGIELLQLRQYRLGDPPRIIDWKASARTQKLISRDFSEDQRLDIILAIDIGRGSSLRAGKLDRLGHYVNVASRFMQYAVDQDDRVGLVLFADRPLVALPPVGGESAITRLRNSIAAIKSENAESNPLHAAVRVRALTPHRSLVVIFTDLDDTTVASQLVGATRLLLPKHLPFIAGLRSADAEQMAATNKVVNWLDPYHVLSAQEYCSGLERKVNALRALGVPAIAARPEQLEPEVFNAYVSFRRKRRV